MACYKMTLATLVRSRPLAGRTVSQPLLRGLSSSSSVVAAAASGADVDADANATSASTNARHGKCGGHKHASNTAQLHNFLPDGCMGYGRGWAWQQTILSRRLRSRKRASSQSQTNYKEDRDAIMLVEHQPVYTLGRGADEHYITFINQMRDGNDIGDDPMSSTASTSSLPSERQKILSKLSRTSRGPGSARLSIDRRYIDEDALAKLPMHEAVQELSAMASPVIAPNGAPIYRVERGGEVTFHGPQQLVVYPMFDLQRSPFRKDLHWYLRQLEDVVIRTLARYGIAGVRDEINTGVWVDKRKIAAVGVSSSRWITTHGFALNVDPDLSYFDTSVIIPCGVEGRGVTSMRAEIQKHQQRQREEGTAICPSLSDVAAVVMDELERVFDVSVARNGTRGI